MTTIFKNKQFHFRFIDKDNSYLKSTKYPYKKISLNKFHKSWFPVFEPYNYKTVYVSGYYSDIINEIIIYQISLMKGEEVSNHIHTYLNQNKDIFEESKIIKQSENYLKNLWSNASRKK